MVRAFLVLAVGFPVLVGGFGVATFFLLPLPTVVPAPRPGALAQTSRIYAPDGSLIATLHAEYNRELIRLDEMPDHLEDATVAGEDARFFRHSGIDTRAIIRALWADLRTRQVAQGGSTITQQYVKNAYIEKPKRTVFRKVREALYAAQVERSLSKRKILENYLNTVYFGRGAYGVQAASKTYFNKNAKDLSVTESAQLVGLISSPNRNSPYEQPERAEARRVFVLERMLTLGYLDQAGFDAALGQKPSFAKPREEVFKYPWFVDSVKRYLIAKYGYDKVFNGGLRVTATIDPKMQEAAEKIVAETLNREGDPHAALVSVDPKTGYVKALVGGRAYETEKFNIAM
ncbi:MAG: transglycosylase domain-containing protein, partial [Acidimicrobiia bacterium]